MCKERKNKYNQDNTTRKDSHMMSSPKRSLSSEEQLLMDHKKEVIQSLIAKSRRQSKQKLTIEDYLNYALLATVILITVLTYPMNNKVDDVVTIHHVWYYGWMTAVATGLGAIPFIFLSEPNKFWMGISNGKLFLAYPAYVTYICFPFE